MREDSVKKLIEQHTEGRTFGIFGDPRINVLALNLALDRKK
jgi:K+-transporting ATPase ATPase C chain